MLVKRTVLTLATLSLSVAHTAPALAVDKAECAQAYEAAQEHRSSGELRQAREKLVVCAQSACPEFIQKDCTKWAGEVDNALPTIVVTAKDAQGNDLTDVRVLFDGEVFAEELSGRAIPVNPGKHELKFESEGAEPVTKQVLISEGQKNRIIDIQFGGGGEAGSIADEGEGSEGSGASFDSDTASNKTLAYVLGGVGVLGLAGFAVFGISGNSEKSDLESTCAPDCTDEQVDPVRQKYLLADISLGVGLVSLGIATYLLVTADDGAQSPEADTALRVDAAPTEGGGFLSIGGRF